MKIVVNKNELVSGLEQLTGIVKENKIRAVLGHALLKATDGRITLIGTDLEETTMIELEGQTEATGEATIEIKQALQLLKLSDEVEIELKTENNILYIGDMEFQMFDPDEFPNIVIDGEYQTLDAESFISAINSTMYAADLKPENVECNCVRVESNFAVATDRFRMAFLDQELEVEPFSLPLKSAVNITKIFADESEIEYFVDDARLALRAGSTTYATRLIDLPFPDARGIIDNAGRTKKAVIDVSELKKALKKALIVVSKNQENKDCATFELKDNMLYINAVSDKSKVKEKVAVEYTDERIKVSLNCKFILDFVSRIKSKLVIECDTNSSPFIMHEQGNVKYKYLAMPLAIKED